MKIRRAFRERIYPTKEQEEKLLWTLDQCRALYNAAIEQRRHIWASHVAGQHLYPVPPKPEGRARRTARPPTPAQQRRRERARAKGPAIDDGFMWRKGITYEAQVHDLVELKAAFPEFAGVNAQILQNVCRRVDLAYAAYGDRKAEYSTRCKARKARGEKLDPPPDPPHFKGKRQYNSFTNPNPLQGWKLEHGGRGPFPVRDPDAPRIPRSTARRELNKDYGRLVLPWLEKINGLDEPVPAGAESPLGERRRTYGKLVPSDIGAIKVRWSRPIEGTVKTITVRREGAEWYVTFSCVLEVEQHAQPARPSTGIDVGIEHYATFEDGSHIENPRYYRKNEALLARRQRVVSTKVEAHKKETAAGTGSSLAAEPLRSKNERLNGARRTNNLARARAQVARAHRKAQRRREYFHHKEAKLLVARVGAIAVEDLSIDNMVRRPKPKLAAAATGPDGAVPAGAESPAAGERRFQHKEAKLLVARVGAIAVEDLSIDNMVRRPKPRLAADAPGSDGAVPAGAESLQEGTSAINDAALCPPVYAPNGASAKSGLNKSINDAAWGTFLFIVQYKAEAAGVTFVQVPAAGTSQECSGCGRVVPKDLSQRWHTCPSAGCGLSLQRDHNSARAVALRAGFAVADGLPTPARVALQARG